MGNNGNPLGAVAIWDGVAPKTITAYAGSAISGGQFVYISGASAVVSSGADSLVTTDMVATLGASGAWFVGVALQNASSGTPVTIATDGIFICEAGGTVTASHVVECMGNNVFQNCGSLDLLTNAYRDAGRALTAAGSEGYFVLKLYA